MSSKYIAAFDQGTTSCRVIIFNENKQVVAMAQEEFSQIFPQSGWVEHDPMEIWSKQSAMFEKALTQAQLKASDIAGIGITNQRETTVVWNKHSGKPIYNAIVWQDSRTSSYCKEVKKEAYLTSYIQENTGLIIDSYFSATKIKWILDQSNESVDDLLCGTIDTWLIWNMTNGETHATDYSNASRTMIFNIKTLGWDDYLLKEFGIPNHLLPEVKNSSDDYGFYTYDGVKIPILGVAGDQQAALFGQMCFDTGMAKNTYGTGCFMLMNTGEELKKSKNGLLTTIAWGLEGKVSYALEGSVFIGGAVIQWLRDGLQIIKDSADSELFAKESKNEQVVVVPAFAGLGAPYWDGDAKGAIYGLTRDVNYKDIVKAALKSIAFQTKDILMAMEKDAQIELKELRVDGGATQNKYMMQFQADILDCVVSKATNHETTALGAALLAGMKAGIWTVEILKEEKATFETFVPKMKETDRSQQYGHWIDAVNRTKN